MKLALFPNTLLFLVATAVLTLSAQAQQKARPAPSSLPGAATEIYKTIGDVTLPIHIYTPKGHRPNASSPAIVFFFGGGWRNGTPEQFAQQCAYLASRGMVAMTAEYRVASRHGVKAISCFQDAKSAIRWVRENAQRLGVDPDRVAAGGGSAGGHLAGALGTISGRDEPGENTAVSAAPNALALFNPALVLAPIKDKMPFDRERIDDLSSRMGVPLRALSPYHNLKKTLPPTIIFHGKADTTVAFETAQLFADKAKSLGTRCELMGYEGQGHGFFNYGKDDNSMFGKTLAATDRFLASLGYLKGKPNVEAFLKTIN